MATDNPLITCTAMSGPFVIQGNSPVRASTYFFCFAAAAARSSFTSSQLRTTSLP